MLNKIYKTINNKYSRFFKFLFFLRYLFAIFIISTSSFLFIPNFFDYEKRAQVIKNHMNDNYNFRISDYKKIKYKALPLPALEFENVQIDIEKTSSNLKVKKMKIYPNLFNIYNYKNFQAKKIILKDNSIVLKALDLKYFISKIFDQNNKLYLNNLNLEIIDKNQSIMTVKNINYANYGYKKNLITGELFGKNFKTKIDSNFKKIKFNLLNSGILAELSLNKNNKEEITSGNIKSKILNTNLKFNFSHNGEQLKISNSYLRNKNLSLNSDIKIIFNPFLHINSKIFIEEINPNLIQKIDLNKFLSFKNILKKINSESEIDFVSKKFLRHHIDNFNLKIDLAYGRMSYSKKISISGNFFNCSGDINFLEDFPLLFFNCNIKSKDKQKFLKLFSIKSKSKNETLNIEVEGNFSILNKKINFKKILVNEKYKASKEDLKYFKETFENLFLKNFSLENFNFNNIKDFILEIS